MKQVKKLKKSVHIDETVNCSLYADELSGSSYCYLLGSGCYLFSYTCKK